jgi:hypothetical protein
MKFNFLKCRMNHAIFVSVVIGLGQISSCASKNENDESMEATEPTDAEPQTAPEAGADASKQPGATGTAPVAGTPSGDLIPSDAAATTPTPTPSASGRRVMYVKVSGAALRETPDPKGKVAGILEKGDHMLVTIEGDWARTDDGKFVSMKVLSDKGVGRGKKDAAWSAGKPVSANDTGAPAKSEIAKKLPKKTANKAAAGAKSPEAPAPSAPAAESTQQQ